VDIRGVVAARLVFQKRIRLLQTSRPGFFPGRLDRNEEARKEAAVVLRINPGFTLS
jgi:hypothetical protein